MKSLVKHNDGKDVGGKYLKQPEFSDRENCRGGSKNRRRPRLFLIIMPVKKKKRKEKKKYVTKIIKPYNTTRIKSRIFLTNISYVGVKEEDLFDRSFVFDVNVLTIKNINPFSLEQKFTTSKTEK